MPKFNERTLLNFRSQLAGGGARSNLFECALQFPVLDGDATANLNNNDNLTKSRFFIKSTQIPSSSIGTINVPFRGRNLKVAGDRTFEPWTITVINDTDFTLRHTFETWMNFINRHGDNAGIINPASYQTNMDVMQLSRSADNNTIPSGSGNATITPNTNSRSSTDKNYGILRQYRFYGVYPSDVSTIELSYDSADTIQEFSVTFQTQYWDVVAPGDNNQGTINTGNIIASSQLT